MEEDGGIVKRSRRIDGEDRTFNDNLIVTRSPKFAISEFLNEASPIKSPARKNNIDAEEQNDTVSIGSNKNKRKIAAEDLNDTVAMNLSNEDEFDDDINTSTKRAKVTVSV